MYDDLPKPPSMTDQEYDIHKQIMSGLPHDRDRIKRDTAILSVYNRDKWSNIPRNIADKDNLPIENSGLTRRIIDLRNSLLYNPAPSRKVLDDDITNRFLGEVYTDNIINELTNNAAELADLLGVSAVGVLPGEGLKPIALYSLDATQFVLKPAEDDAYSPAHMIVIDQVGGRLRYTWWSANARRVYLSKKSVAQNYLNWNPNRHEQSAEMVEDTINPFGRIPFALFHHSLPFGGMVSRGEGEWLADGQRNIDARRYWIGLALKNYSLPQKYVTGVTAEWQPTDYMGEIMKVPDGKFRGENITPTFGVISAPFDVDGLRAYVDAEIDKLLQGAGVPRPIFYMENNGLSGTAIYAEQKPLRDMTNRRRAGLKLYETDLAQAICAVGGYILADKTLSNALTSAGLGGLNLTVEWEPDITTPEDNTQDQWDLANGVQSIVDIVRNRYKLDSDQQAIDRIVKVQNDNLKVAGILNQSGVILNDENPPANSDLQSSLVSDAVEQNTNEE